MNNGSIAMTIAEPSTPLGKATGKAFRRLVWFLFLCYVISYLDRINISFAALSMNKALGLSAASFGLASTIFYTGYACRAPGSPWENLGDQQPEHWPESDREAADVGRQARRR